ncbi:MAG TPA: cytochrome P450 [Acidimicrobiales bacterium]|jgi:cytochrome P450|nr:cytochrome P450 [Acidimicrobiales bacterium]
MPMYATDAADEVRAPERFNPFELQDTVSGDIRDPYPRLGELRRRSPVHLGPVDLGDGAAEVDPNRPPPVTVFGFDEAVQVLRDNQTYSSSVYEGIMGAVMGRTILQMDEPEHRLHRALVSPTFRSKVLERWEGGLVRQVVDELIDGFVAQGAADLVQELTFNFPVQVIAQILGLPRSDFPVFQRWAIEITSVASSWERGVAASAALRDYFAAVLAERRLRPADDLISDLLVAEVDGRRLDDEEIYSFLRLLLPAGVETTYRASGNLLYGLLTNPDQLRAVMDDRSLVPAAFEESIRWEPPVTVILRRATRATELAGVPVDEGADVGLLLGSANRDERKFADPDRFDIFRASRQSVGFGFGVHVCLGMHLARMEARVAVNTLFDRLPDMHLAAAADQDLHIKGMAFRSPIALPVGFAPA